jgi:ribose/xylose/arabinose/galactoside ABC-type transport system permease subunit
MRDGIGNNAVSELKGTKASRVRYHVLGSLQKSFLLLALIGVFIGMGILEPRFLSFNNLINIARQISIDMIIAVGMTFCMVTGGFDLSVGSVGVMSGCLTAIVMLASGSVTLGLLCGLLTGAAAGFLNGFTIAKVKVNPLVTTLGMMVAARGAALIMTGGDVIMNLPEAFNFIGVGFIARIPVPILIAVIVLAIGYLVLSKTEYGLNCYAVGGNYDAAKLAGLENNRVIIIAYTVQGLLAAMGGIVLSARVISAQPALMHDTALYVIAAVVVGGTRLGGGAGTMGGTLLGVILIGALFNGLNIIGVGYEWQQVIIGLIIVIAVIADNLSRK